MRKLATVKNWFMVSAAGMSLAVSASAAEILPACAKDGTCRDVSDLVVLGINVAKYLFSIVGALALGALVYGGVILIMSEGNQEKVKTGGGAIVAAVAGLMVAFAGYVLVQFLGQAVGLKAGFKLF